MLLILILVELIDLFDLLDGLKRVFYIGGTDWIGRSLVRNSGLVAIRWV